MDMRVRGIRLIGQVHEACPVEHRRPKQPRARGLQQLDYGQEIRPFPVIQRAQGFCMAVQHYGTPPQVGLIMVQKDAPLGGSQHDIGRIAGANSAQKTSVPTTHLPLSVMTLPTEIGN